MKPGDSCSWRGHRLFVNGRAEGTLGDYDATTGIFTWKRFGFWRRLWYRITRRRQL